MFSLESLIETLAQQCLIAQGQAIAAYEAEIDDIVACLYGLPIQSEPSLRGRRSNDQRG